jgi:hypothetical protein
MRHYNFEFPLNVPGRGFFLDYVSILIDRLVAADLWPSTTKVGKLPPPLAHRLLEAQRNGTGIAILQADLDSIPDDVWARIAVVIGKEAPKT